ncbi:MAG: hypothetical protein F4X65_13010 [Chloroflexi bacterium]|nr:hypothetical protein [Chloroflexota bacterium]
MDEVKCINLWYDNAWPHLDVTWLRRIGFVAPTENEDLDVKVDSEGNVLGFMLTGIRHLKGRTLTGNLQQVDVDDETGRAQHDKPVGPGQFALPHYCGVPRNEGIHFQADGSGDCIEVKWGSGKGEYTPTGDERVQGLRDAAGNILGFRISGISLMGENEKDFINVDIYPTDSYS